MNRIAILENEGMSLWYYPDTKIVHHQFHIPVSGKRFRETLMAGTEVLKKNNARKWLSDDRAYTEPLPPEDMEWGFQEWGPKNVLAGWRFWAIVLPPSFIGQMSLTKIEKTYSSIGVVAKVFTEPDEAMSWLEAQ
jgi:hypothetical protein